MNLFALFAVTLVLAAVVLLTVRPTRRIVYRYATKWRPVRAFMYRVGARLLRRRIDDQISYYAAEMEKTRGQPAETFDEQKRRAVQLTMLTHTHDALLTLRRDFVGSRDFGMLAVDALSTFWSWKMQADAIGDGTTFVRAGIVERDKLADVVAAVTGGYLTVREEEILTIVDDVLDTAAQTNQALTQLLARTLERVPAPPGPVLGEFWGVPVYGTEIDHLRRVFPHIADQSSKFTDVTA